MTGAEIIYVLFEVFFCFIFPVVTFAAALMIIVDAGDDYRSLGWLFTVPTLRRWKRKLLKEKPCPCNRCLGSWID